MKKRARNYKAEYANRIARGKALGRSVSQSRGHPKTKTVKTKRGKRREAVEISAAAIKRANAEARARGIRPILESGATMQDLRAAVVRDALYAFGEVPRRQHEDGSAPEYQLRLEMLEARQSAFDWKNEAKFIGKMQALGASERFAYSLWFSPGGTQP